MALVQRPGGGRLGRNRDNPSQPTFGIVAELAAKQKRPGAAFRPLVPYYSAPSGTAHDGNAFSTLVSPVTSFTPSDVASATYSQS